MAKQPSNKKANTIGAALSLVGTSGKANTKLTPEQKIKAAKERATAVLHDRLDEAQFAVAMEFVADAAAHKAAIVSWVGKSDDYVGRMYAPSDKVMLANVKSGKEHIDAIGKALQTLSGTSWARTMYRAALVRFLYGKASDKKLPGARRAKVLSGTQFAKRAKDATESLVAAVKLLDKNNVNASVIKACAASMAIVAKENAKIQKMLVG